MPFQSFSGVGLRGLAAAVPSNIIDNYQYTDHFPVDEVKAVVDKIGVYQRRFANASTCASDLCAAAAEKLFADLDTDRSQIDLLIFVSKTPDYRMPATSIVLQERLGLSSRTMAFDINLACSGFINGLAVVYALMQQATFRKALLLTGETRSKVYSPKDRGTAFLFGDGGTAAIIEKNPDYGQSFFSMNSDGSREGLIKAKAGGYRNPSTSDTFKEEIIDEHGNKRSQEHGYMNGPDVFNFVLREIPKDISNLLEFSQARLECLDYYLFHQANSFMNSYLMKKMKLPQEKVPTSISKFGNTSSVSIPLTMVSELKGRLDTRKAVLLSGFGAGMSWASAIINLVDCHLSEIVEI